MRLCFRNFCSVYSQVQSLTACTERERQRETASWRQKTLSLPHSFHPTWRLTSGPQDGFSSQRVREGVRSAQPHTTARRHFHFRRRLSAISGSGPVCWRAKDTHSYRILQRGSTPQVPLNVCQIIPVGRVIWHMSADSIISYLGAIWDLILPHVHTSNCHPNTVF